MDYRIAIPSYRRADTLVARTLRTLKTLGVSDDRVTVFVADQQDLQAYKSVVPSSVAVVLGAPGLLAQRQFYNGYYEKGTRLLNIDDDLFALKTISKDGKRLVDAGAAGWSLDAIVDYAFRVCERHGARLWGISAVENAFYMKPATSVGLKYICGIFHGSYAGDASLCGADRARVSSGEDFETTIRSHKDNGCVVRLDWLCPKTKYFAAGGMREELGGTDERRQIEHTKELHNIARRHPAYATVYTKAGGVTNLKLMRLPSQVDRSPLPFTFPA
jgi:hypothetical protein